eukprot:TRINITY_DN9034_c3_g3_i1.p1 TRINITY_DN9034_c3_g3~~TRINITY_DN9034_c3_g3_i1.p1  ORF type:complete len:102 (-),score=5.32 TRINITY_DN9034_c3_g3_i1:118-423(-)
MEMNMKLQNSPTYRGSPFIETPLVEVALQHIILIIHIWSIHKDVHSISFIQRLNQVIETTEKDMERIDNNIPSVINQQLFQYIKIKLSKAFREKYYVVRST